MPFKTACPHCTARLVLKREVLPAHMTCPKCQQRFRPEQTSAPEQQQPLPRAAPGQQSPATAAASSVERPSGAPLWQPGGSSADLMRAVVNAFHGQAVHRPPTLGYRLALLLSACGLLVLIVAYIACASGIGFGLYFYVQHVVPASLQIRGRALLMVIMMHVAVVGAGLAVLYSLLAPLFRWQRTEAESTLLHSAAHPVLHCFVRALCDLIAAPKPDEIRLNSLPNASAGRHGGVLGILGGRLVLEIGEPLFYGLDLRALAGIIAHELGHFSQATSGWIFRYIAAVSNWFQEATLRTSGVQEAITEHGSDTEGSAGLLMLVAYCLTGLGRLILLQFALLSRITTYYLLRQMEFDADRYEAEVAGSAQFARTFERLSELSVAFEIVLLAALRGELTGDPDQQFSERVVAEANQLSEKARRRVAKALAPQSAGWFDSHPSPTERISAVSRRPHAGIFQLEGPAICLLNTQALSRDRSRGG